MPKEFWSLLERHEGMDIHKILTALLALGPKLPEVMQHVEAIMAEVSALVAIFQGEEPKMYGACPMSDDEAAMCEQAEEVLASGSALYAGPGGRIANLLAFLKEHPELVALVLKLIGG